MASAALRAVKALPDSGKVKAFARRIGQFVSRDEGRPAITGCTRVAPGVWAATCGHQLSLIPSPILADGTRWGDDAPLMVPFRPGDLATLCDIGVPRFTLVQRVADKGTGARPVPAQWQVAAGCSGDGFAWAIDANFPDYTKVIPRLADLPHAIEVNPAAIRALFAPGPDDVWTPAERLRAGGKVKRLGPEAPSRGNTALKFSADGKCGCLCPVATKVRDDDGNATGQVANDMRALGDLGDAPAIVAFDPALLLAMAIGDAPFTLHVTDTTGPALARIGGEAHVIMPMRM